MSTKQADESLPSAPPPPVEEEQATKPIPEGLTPLINDFARQHRSELFNANTEVPSLFQDMTPLIGPVEAGTYFVPSSMSGSDTGATEKSNYRSFLRNYKDEPGIYPLVGGHNSFAVAIRLNVLDHDMLELFDSLEDSAMDDQDVAQVEYEQIEDAWHNSVSMEFEQALISAYPDLEEEISGYSAAQLKALFERLMKRTGTKWSQGDGSVWIDVHDVASGAIPEDFTGVVEAVPSEPEPEESEPEEKQAGLSREGLPDSVVMTHRDGEYRVNYRGGKEETAYYTNDRADAKNTAQRMVKEKAKQAAGQTKQTYSMRVYRGQEVIGEYRFHATDAGLADLIAKMKPEFQFDILNENGIIKTR